MIDDDDVALWAIFGPTGGWVVTTIFLVVFAFLAVRSCENKDACARMHCDTGKPALVKGKCVCLAEATP